MKSVVAVQTLFVLVFWGGTTLNAQLIVAHRGASHEAPENTCAAFALAWSEDADASEGDFYLTSDDRIVCFHDKTTERVTQKKTKLAIAKSTLEELQSLDVGSWKADRYADERIPTLRQVIAMVPEGKLFYIEVKCGPEIVPVLKKELTDLEFPDEQLRIICFDDSVIAAAKRALPSVQAYLLSDFEFSPQDQTASPSAGEIVARAKAVGADGVGLKGNVAAVNRQLIDTCRRSGLSVHVWTVNDPQIARTFQALGVDSITTNHPGLMKRELKVEP